MSSVCEVGMVYFLWNHFDIPHVHYTEKMLLCCCSRSRSRDRHRRLVWGCFYWMQICLILCIEVVMQAVIFLLVFYRELLSWRFSLSACC